MINLCYLCRKVLQQNLSWNLLTLFQKPIPICANCAGQFVQLEPPFCKICHKMSNLSPCVDCKRRQITKQNFILTNKSLYTYNEFAKAAMKQYKYQGDYVLREIFSLPLKKLIRQANYDYLVPIPLAKSRQTERGFNQVAAMLDHQKLTYQSILTKCSANKQSKLKRKDRLTRKQDFLFQGDKKAIFGKRILLVDDVYTTGATVHLAAKLLLENSAAEVSSVTVFR